jgi:hypothetical protein
LSLWTATASTEQWNLVVVKQLRVNLISKTLTPETYFFVFKGRVSMFTSGGENLHYVEKVTDGIRYALTIAFTCDVEKAIPDPQFRH